MITAFNLIIERSPNADKKKKRKKLYKDTTKKDNIRIHKRMMKNVRKHFPNIKIPK